ncbi:MAG: hypothetical protein JW929_15765 [Anaerolineales bacterium]|nr:hypothetical protein [Anaerolineales bacterium]
MLNKDEEKTLAINLALLGGGIAFLAVGLSSDLSVFLIVGLCLMAFGVARMMGKTKKKGS